MKNLSEIGGIHAALAVLLLAASSVNAILLYACL